MQHIKFMNFPCEIPRCRCASGTNFTNSFIDSAKHFIEERKKTYKTDQYSLEVMVVMMAEEKESIRMFVFDFIHDSFN